MEEEEETITAVATAEGSAALAIVRISGKNAFYIVEKIIKEENFNRIHERYAKRYTIIEKKSKKVIDEVIAIKYKGPRSYTGEDSVEIISHGGFYTVKKIIEQVIKNGARIAKKGEFSRRAFFNGKIDLMKAEAIQALIESRNENEYSIAIKSYEGNEKRIKTWGEKIKKEIVFLEADIEYGEDENIEIQDKDEIKEIIIEINEEINRAKKIKEIRRGYKITIAGPPNAGKSSLFNYLLGYKRAIENENPGTTRDLISEKIQINGKEITINDTAGIRKTEDTLEEEGMKKSEEAINEANIIIWITDIGEDLKEEEEKRIKMLDEKNTIYILNKIDKKENKKKNLFFKRIKEGVIKISVKEKINTKSVIRKIELKINKIIKEKVMPDIIINERQIKIAEKLLEELKNAEKNWKRKEIASYYLRESIKKIEEITGKVNNDDIINEIFNNFCLGK